MQMNANIKLKYLYGAPLYTLYPTNCLRKLDVLWLKPSLL